MTANLSLLLVDDVEENLFALQAALEPLGLAMVLARSGPEALGHLLRREDFATVVLDVQMPGMDGFETAEAIRARERNTDLPIIFLTALSRDEDHRMRGFAAGAVDYLFKPVDPELLRAKVDVFVRLRSTQLELQRQSDAVRRQAEALARSNADLDQFASIVSHDLLDPLNVLAGYLELLSAEIGDGADGRARDWMARMEACAGRMHELVVKLLDYSRAGGDDQAGPGPATDPALALADAVANLDTAIATSGSRVDLAGELMPVCAGRRELAQIFQNLIGNSVAHAGRPVAVTVSAAGVPGNEGQVTIRVSDDGPGLTELQMRRVVGPVEQGGPTPRTGLGLAICRRIADRFGGSVRMEANPAGGLSVLVTLPAADPA